MVGHRFTGDQGAINLFPQNGVPDGALKNFNGSAMARLENELADWVEAGAEVDYRVRLDDFTPGGRPDTVSVEYTVRGPDGRVIYDNDVNFENTAGQVFGRVSRREIEAMMQ